MELQRHKEAIQVGPAALASLWQAVAPRCLFPSFACAPGAGAALMLLLLASPVLPACPPSIALQDFTVCLNLPDCSPHSRFQSLLFRGNIKQAMGALPACLPACLAVCLGSAAHCRLVELWV